MMRGEVTALQLLLVVSLIRQPHHQSHRRMIDSVAPAQQRQEDCPGPIREVLGEFMDGIQRSCKCVGVLAIVHRNGVSLDRSHSSQAITLSS